jgi:PKD repeat protein
MGGNTDGLQYGNTDTTMLQFCKGSISKICFSPKSVQGPGFNCNYPDPIIDSIFITGGTVLGYEDNCVWIRWDTTDYAYFDVYWTMSADASTGQACRSFASLYIDLLDKPFAYFTAIPQPACFSDPTTITFNSDSSTGGNVYLWDFGDGMAGVGANPSHDYTAAGTYEVCLYYWKDTSGGFPLSTGHPAQGAGQIPCTTCVDTFCSTITIDALPPPPINCITTVCDSNTSQYCTDNTCGSYSWSVIGGSIIGGTGTPCILVKWGSGIPQGTINLSTSGCATPYCSNGNSVTVPIVPDTAYVTGLDTVCIDDITTYSMPLLPGTTYIWSLSGGGSTLIGNDHNTNTVGVNWLAAGTYTLNVVYNNTMTKCGGDAHFIIEVLPALEISGLKKICENSVGIYTAADAFAGSPMVAFWQVTPIGPSITGQNSPAAFITFPTAGTYTITANGITPTLSCKPTTFVVQVRPNPIITDILGPTDFCINGIADYGAVSNNNSGSFAWTVTNGTFITITPNNDSVQITWGGTGPYSASVQQTSSYGCLSNLYSENFIPSSPATITGPTSVCADATTMYTVTSPTSGVFNWFITPAQYGTIVSGQNTNTATITWNGNNAPGATNTVFLHFGICGTDSIAINITDPTPLIISQSGSLCAGGIGLTTSAASGIYNWGCLQHPITPAQSTTLPTLSNINQGGTYVVTVNNVNGSGCNANGSINISSAGSPNAVASASGPTGYCFPTLPSVSLNATTGAGYTYEWILGGSVIGTGSSLVVNNTAPANITTMGLYSFTLVVTLNNCTDTSLPVIITVDSCASVSSPGCSGALVIDSIKGCNPFDVYSTITGPSGSSPIPGSQTITHLDDLTFAFGTTTKTYTSIGYKIIRVCQQYVMPDLSICSVCRDTSILVPLAAKFTANENCGTVTFTNSSAVVSPVSIASYAWSVTTYPANGSVPPSQASFNNAAIASPTLTFSVNGTFYINLTVTGSNGCVVTYTDTVTSHLADATFSVAAPCVGSSTVLSGNLTAPANYWNFGDGASSYVDPTVHTYATSGTYSVIHAVENAFGCKDTSTSTIVIQPRPTCMLTPLSTLTICSGDSSEIAGCAGYSGYQWYKNGAIIPGATATNYFVTTTGMYHLTANDPTFGCFVISDTLNYLVNPSPIVALDSTGPACAPDLVSFTTPDCAGCIFTWSVDNSTVTGIGNMYSEYANTFPLSIGTHTVTVNVTNSFACTSTDSSVINVNLPPSVVTTIVGPIPYCSGNTYTITASTTASPAIYAWSFNNFTISNNDTLIASAGGAYLLTITDGTTGCTATDAQVIADGPILQLYPIGCDQICDSEAIVMPIPNIGGSIAGYTITWYDGAPPYIAIGSGPSVPAYIFSPIGASHNVSVIVSAPNGCVDTSDIFQFEHTADCSNPLNASALVLQGSAGDEGLEVSWQTRQSDNTQKMDVQRSMNAIDFATIEALESGDWVPEFQTNTHIDKDIESGTMYYYRVRQHLLNGTAIVSNTVQLSKSIHEFDCILYPTIANTFCNMQVTTAQDMLLNIAIKNTLGIAVYTSTSNVKKGTQTFALDVSTLPAGTYVLQAVSNEFNFTRKFTKQ